MDKAIILVKDIKNALVVDANSICEGIGTIFTSPSTGLSFAKNIWTKAKSLDEGGNIIGTIYFKTKDIISILVINNDTETK